MTVEQRCFIIRARNILRETVGITALNDHCHYVIFSNGSIGRLAKSVHRRITQ